MRVESIEHLKQLCTEGKHEFYIMLNFGLRSSKYIVYDEFHQVFNVLNEIDGSDEVLSELEIEDKSLTNIGFAIQKGSFFTYE